jgi:hypothetical protein
MLKTPFSKKRHHTFPNSPIFFCLIFSNFSIGYSGKIVINENGTRQPIFYIYGLNAKHEQIPYIIISMEGNSTVRAKNIEKYIQGGKLRMLKNGGRGKNYGKIFL